MKLVDTLNEETLNELRDITKNKDNR
jgi:hypothetical protein